VNESEAVCRRASRVDNGSEFCSNALEARAMGHDVQLCFIPPGRLVENGLFESFNAIWD
jgi:putative transposase